MIKASLLFYLSCIIFIHALNPAWEDNQRKEDIFYDPSTNNVIYFLQITDIHLVRPNEGKQISNFNTFFEKVLPEINPLMVLATGDLTNGKKQMLQSGQIIEEWESYRNILQNHGYYNESFWYDVKGNHDCVRTEETNNFNQYSVTGYYNRSNIYDFYRNTSNGIYHFIGIDTASPKCGALFLSSMGHITRRQLDELDLLLDKPANHTFLFGHHPQGMIDMNILSSNGKSMSEILKNHKVSIFILGHLHNAVGPYIAYHRKYPPYWEMEMRDFKQYAHFRIYGIDNDLISFVDTNVEEFLSRPIVLILNPKDSKFQSEVEPLYRMKYSNIIRFIVFGKWNITSISLNIDGKNIYQSQSFEDVLTNNIFSIPYNSSIYSSGEHILNIEITVNGSKVYSSERIFTLNGDSTLFSPSFSTFVLTFPLSSLTFYGFWIIVILMWMILPLLYCLNRRVTSKSHKTFTPNEIINIRSTILVDYFNPPKFVLKYNYLKELCNFFTYRMMLFYNCKWKCYYYYFVICYIPIFPIIFQQTFSSNMYLWSHWGTLYVFKGQLMNPLDSHILYCINMLVFWFPSVLYLCLFNNYRDLKELTSLPLKISLWIFKIMVLLSVVISSLVIVFVFTISLFPDSLYSPLLFNTVYVLICIVILK